jgi:cytidine diphosphoramidate kinase
MIIWLIGISGSGKSTIGKSLHNKLKRKVKNLVYIDGDEFRALMNNDLGYSITDRDKNAKRMIKFIKFLSDQKINVICAANLTNKKYQLLAKKVLKKKYFEIFVKTSIKTLIENRDYKKLYKKAIQKKIKNVVGIDLKYDEPKNSNLVIENEINRKNFSQIIDKIITKTNILKKN